ncbi:molybdenum ABC transporter, periplasmic molybdate-binding protein [Rivularia sp. PCC 7116]|uniref:molybdate ABC transporter substrate-binding protein n=1 Tax=Rivularia sp. PCC 7116 TaxID=373994 RepID=UPI00029F2D70|nr:molybdate ABC transporter substrate-binding protein [Rivularia sp. PCC 7116]AFY59104.1 molybdenum ABC transporter, periplasmic molybdate-binding protein [Rivularia sp. PCC 7116]
MNKTPFVTLISWVLISFLTIVGCNQVTSTTNSQAIELTVSAAASMQDALKEVAKVYQEEYPNTKITYNFASSGTLTQQIKQGAPVDIFISANERFMDELDKKNILLSGSRKDLLKNNVVLIVPKKDNINNVSNFQELTNPNIKRFSIGEPESVPAGQYAKQVLSSLKIYEQIKPKTVFAKDVRQVLAYVELGNVDAGIVYATDAKISKKIKIVATASENNHKAIIYPVAAIKRTKNPEAAKEFIQFLFSNPAKDTFNKYGFQIAG